MSEIEETVGNEEKSELIPMERWVNVDNEENLTTDSRTVAKVFGKEHKDVLRAIRNLECSPEFAERNLTLCFENNGLQNGKPQPFYEMTFDGFIMLAMGFTGREAMVIKERYINAFNEMREMIRDGHYGLIGNLNKALQAEAISKTIGTLAGRALQRRKIEKKRNYEQIKKWRDLIQPDLFAALHED